ncbi:hypothetical protein MASR2M15_20890 [Anaerolineales bacterium]
MKIFVVEPLGHGGLIHYSFHMCKGLRKNGADVTLVTSTEWELAGIERDFEVANILHLWNAREKSPYKGIRRKLERVERGFKWVREWFHLLRFLKQEKPDVVLFGEIRFGFEYYFLKRMRKASYLTADIVHDVQTYDTSQASDQIIQESESSRKTYERIYQQFDALFVHDRTNYDLFLKLFKIPKKRVHEIPHGANELMLNLPQTRSAAQIRRDLNIEADVPCVLFFGTVAKYKGIFDLLEAFPAVYKGSAAHLIVAGYPAKDIKAEELTQLAEELGIADQVHWWLDYVPNEDVVPLMEAGDVVVLPYRAISQSGIIHIANACGRPVVATRVGGLQDVIEDGKSGYLVEPENIAALSEGLIAALADPQHSQALGRYARELAQTKYSWENVAKLVIQALEGTEKHG